MIEFKTGVIEAPSNEMEACWTALFRQQQARFFELPKRRDLWERSALRARQIQEKFDTTLAVGIGGSSLGARALAAAFSRRDSHRVLFAEAPGAGSIPKLREVLGDLRRVHFLFISKSGQTLETLALLDYWSQVMAEAGLTLESQSTVISGEGTSPLRDWAKTRNVPSLPVPGDIGGRFSVLSPVGLLPAALLGISLERLQAGAEWALGEKQRVCDLAQATVRSFQERRWITQLWVYSEAFYTLGLWWQQLWGESLAKKATRGGKPAPRVSTPMVCLGPQDQHSLLQQLHEGEPDKWVICLRDTCEENPIRKFNAPVLSELEKSCVKTTLGDVLRAEAEGFLGSLNSSGIPNLTMFTDSSQPEAWGAFFMFWELTVAVLGERLDIDAFNQPGVELGKRLALQALKTRP